jgi:hypothetical protein
MVHRSLAVLTIIGLTGCSAEAWERIGIIAGTLGASALATATGGNSGPGGAFDPQRYDPARDARYNHDVPRRPLR